MRSCPLDSITFNLGNLLASSYTAYDARLGIRVTKKSFDFERRLKTSMKTKQNKTKLNKQNIKERKQALVGTYCEEIPGAALFITGVR